MVSECVWSPLLLAGFVLVRFFGDYYTDLKGGGNNCWVYTVRAEIEGSGGDLVSSLVMA